MKNDVPAVPNLPVLIKSSFYSYKHYPVIYIETMPGHLGRGEININYSNPLHHLHQSEGLERFLFDDQRGDFLRSCCLFTDEYSIDSREPG